MILNADTAFRTASHLMQIKAIKLQPEKPFTWASGWKSPIYCDNRISLSFPEVRNYIKEQIARGIVNKYGKPDVIAGVATGAIAIGILVAQELDLPFVYIRPEPKKHGRQNQVEGHLPENSKVVVIEDLISTGGSSLKAVEALQQTDADVLGMAAIFTYGFPIAQKNFSDAACSLFTLCDYESLLQMVKEKGQIDNETLVTLQEWRKDPANWKK